MKTRQVGFTLVEVLIVLVILVILMTLGISQLNGAQSQSRDSERAADISVIARALEQRYNNENNLFKAAAGSEALLNAGQYPGVAEIVYGKGSARSEFNPTTPAEGDSRYLLQAFNTLTKDSLQPPSATGFFDVICTSSCSAAENQTQLNNRFLISGVPGDKYIYEPVDSSGNVCMGSGCVRFNLYWRSEVDTVSPVKKVESQHR